MTVPEGSGFQRKAAFSFRGADSELDRSAPLAAGEVTLVHGGLRAREAGLIRSPDIGVGGGAGMAGSSG